jgi:thioredoxin 1
MASKNVRNLDDQTFDEEVLKAQEPVIVDFHAAWCGPCKLLGPIIEKIADDYEGKVKVAKVDVAAAPRVVQRYNVANVPTVMVFDKGEQKAVRFGVVRREQLLEMAGITS